MPSLSSQRKFSRIATIVAVLAITSGFAGIAFSQANNFRGGAPVILENLGCAGGNPNDVLQNHSGNRFMALQAKCDSLAEWYGFTEGVMQPSISTNHICLGRGQHYWVCSGVGGGGCGHLNCSTGVSN